MLLTQVSSGTYEAVHVVKMQRSSCHNFVGLEFNMLLQQKSCICDSAYQYIVNHQRTSFH